MNEFPVAPAKGMVILPVVAQAAFAPDEHQVAVEVLSLAEHGRQNTFSFNIVGHPSSGGCAGGGVEIHGNSHKIATGACLDFTRPNGAGWHFQATLIHVLFAPTMIAIGAGNTHLSPVVTGENG